MSEDNRTKIVIGGPGIGIAGALTITFVVLKSLGYLSWSWWWVFAPLWITFGLGVLAIGVAIIIAIIIALTD